MNLQYNIFSPYIYICQDNISFPLTNILLIIGSFINKTFGEADNEMSNTCSILFFTSFMILDN